MPASTLSSVANFFNANLAVVYFVYGLAFFALGFAFALQAISPIRLPKLNHVLILVAFGFLHGLREWLAMANLVTPSSAVDSNAPLRIVEVSILILSFAFLLEFGIASLGISHKLPVWLNYVPALLVLLIGLYIVNRAPAFGGLGHPVWTAISEAIARYAIGFPGSIITALALWEAARLLRGSRAPQIGRSFTGAAIAFALYGILAGLIPAPAPFFPASAINTASFQALFGIPVQVFRALCAVAISYFTIQGYFVEATRYTNTMNNLLVSLNESSRAISAKLDLPEILELIVRYARRLLSADTSFLSLVTEDGKELQMAASSGVRTEALRQLRIATDQGLAGAAIHARGPVLMDDYFGESDIRGRALDVVRQEGIISGIAAPMFSDNRLMGVLYVFNRQFTRFGDTDAAVLASLAAQAAIAIEHARLYTLEKERVERLQQLDQLKNEFISITSHEFRTPLTVIKGWADFLRSRPMAKMKEDQVSTALDSISHEAGRLSDLVEKVLNVSRIESGALPFRPQRFRLVDAIDSVVGKLDVQAKPRGIRIEVEAGKPIEVYADPNLTEQIQVNLISNAIKYTFDNTVITVTARTDDGKALVSVHDQGPGIPPEQIPLLFGRFVRLARPGAPEKPGAGLGLYITKRLVEMHGGNIWAVSEPGKGTTFYFTLPLYQ